jgi:hypothetical protein
MRRVRHVVSDTNGPDGCEAWLRIHSPTRSRVPDRPSPTVVPRSPSACFTREEARRARSPWPFGYPGEGLQLRVGAKLAVTPVTFSTDVCYPRFRFQRTGTPVVSVHSASHSHAMWEISDSRRASRFGEPTRLPRSVSSPCAVFGVPLTLRHRGSVAPARGAEVLGARAPNRANVRWCRPAGHAKWPRVVTRPVQVVPPASRERHGFDQTRSAFPLRPVHPAAIVSPRAPVAGEPTSGES